MSIKTSIITINYNGLADTCALIDTIPFNDETLEVIVVDNASKKDEATYIEQRYPKVKVIRSKENLGFAGGNNLGIKAAHGQYLFFINNDTLLECRVQKAEGRVNFEGRANFEGRVQSAECRVLGPECRRQSAEGRVQSAECRVLGPECREQRSMDTGEKSEVTGFFQSLIDRLESSPKIGMVCPKIRFAWGNKPIQYAGYTPLSPITMRNRSIGFGEEDHGQYDMAHTTPYAHGAAMMVKREAIEKAGVMPECYFLYYEELDWSMMIRRAGYDIWYEPAWTIYHKESQATGQNSPLRTYYITRNRLMFVQRNNTNTTRYLTYLYLIVLVAIKDMARYTMQRRPDLAKATAKGIYHFLKHKAS